MGNLVKHDNDINSGHYHLKHQNIECYHNCPFLKQLDNQECSNYNAACTRYNLYLYRFHGILSRSSKCFEEDFDPSRKNISIETSSMTIEEKLDYIIKLLEEK